MEDKNPDPMSFTLLSDDRLIETFILMVGGSHHIMILKARPGNQLGHGLRRSKCLDMGKPTGGENKELHIGH